jgi:hypothetical protein
MHKYCTIVSSHYLPQALTLSNSFNEVYPNERLSVLVIDLDRGQVPLIDNMDFYVLSDLGIAKDTLTKMLSYYDVVEFATAMKPSFLLRLLDEGATTVSYIDPDIYLFNSLDAAQSAATRGGAVLTPHRLTPLPFQPDAPKELSFFRVGIYNLGFICVSSNAREMLYWWQERLRWHASQFDHLPYFTDQKWVDFFPTFEGCTILRHPGYNLAFWNLDERSLCEFNERVSVNEQLLVFIHFSQMSSTLKETLKSDLWGRWLASNYYDEESLSIITRLSEEYGKKLRESSQYIANLNLEPEIVFLKVSKFRQMKLIDSDIAKSNIPHEKFINLRNRLSSTFLWLEKSSALNGFRLGLKKDLKKIEAQAI